MVTANEQWVGAYYPLETILNRRSKVLMCLLFDRVMLHFPISGMACGGGSGVSDMVLEDSQQLVDSGVLEPIEEILLSDVNIEFSPGHFWGTDEEFDKYIRLQVTAMALNACNNQEIVPVTDDPKWPIPASLVENLDILRFAHLQASALAIQCLEITLPTIANIEDEEILMAREELNEQLIPFRRAMLALSPAVRNGIEHEAKLGDIYREARYIVDTQVSPALGELQYRLQKEKGKFWRKLLLKGSSLIPKFILNWTTQGTLSATMNAIIDAKDITLDLINRKDFVSSMIRHGGLGYLLAVAENPHFRKATKSKC